MENSNKKVAVITGASSGIGLTTAKYFRENGFVIYNLSRRKVDEKGIISITCDVTSVEQVKDAINQIVSEQGQIDVLINNAGFGISGSSENQSLEDVEKLFKVNFMGAVNVTQQVLPIMRKQRNGKIINTGSVAGVFPIPFQSFYSATKSAIDMWAKALRLEVKPFGVQVGTVLVGDTKTNFTDKREKSTLDDGTDYEEVVKKSIAKMERDEQKGKDPITVAKVMLKLASSRKMPATKVVGGSYKLLVFLNKILPQRFMLWVVGKLYS